MCRTVLAVRTNLTGVMLSDVSLVKKALGGLKWMQTCIVDREIYQYFKLKLHAAINYFFNSELNLCVPLLLEGQKLILH